jgi:hypothetical protein
MEKASQQSNQRGKHSLSPLFLHDAPSYDGQGEFLPVRLHLQDFFENWHACSCQSAEFCV